MLKKLNVLYLIASLFFLGTGITLGLVLSPLITAEVSATQKEVNLVKQQALYSGEFDRHQPGSDALYWASGKVYLNENVIAFEGEIAPGPHYKIYLTKTQAFDQHSFLQIKHQSALIGDLNNFGDFIKSLPEGIDPQEYCAVQIWSEQFSKFVGSARYRT